MFKKIIISLLLLALLVGCGNNSANSDLNIADMSEYKIESDRFLDTTLPEAVELINQSAIFYFGYPDCPWCLELVPILAEVLSEKNIYVHYINVQTAEFSDIRDEENSDFTTLLNFFSEHLIKPDGVHIEMPVPFVVGVKNGVISQSNLGTLPTHNAYERLMSDQEKAQLKELLSKLVESIN
ncbi:MAG: hypothetical protein ACK5G7_06010 [Erysipelotrichaceae bacterium]